MSKSITEKSTSARVSVWPNAREWWQALRYVFLTFTFVIAITLLGSFVPYEQVVAEGHPWLPHTHCTGCPFCGMTRSFCALSDGRWQEAFQWNRGGPILYIGGWLWLVITLVVIVRITQQKRLRNAQMGFERNASERSR